jgi:hypothetical protein
MTPHTIDKLGAELRVGDIVVQDLPDGSCDIHRIGRIAEYPAARNTAGQPMPNFVGDTSFVAVIPDGIDFDIECGWCGHTERNVALTAEDARRAADGHACHARIAYGTGDIPSWRHTVADHEHFHVLAEFKPTSVPPPPTDLDRYLPPPCERLVWPEPIQDPAYPTVAS